MDFSAVPHLQKLATGAEETGNFFYPVICAMLDDGAAQFPSQFDIGVKKNLSSGRVGETRLTRVWLDGRWLEQVKEDRAAIDAMLVHEMTHVAQHYYRPIIGHWLVRTSNPPSFWEEGIAEYVCYRLGLTNASGCPKCDGSSPHYRDGYSCAASFLLYVESTYNSNLVRNLNSIVRRGDYTDEFFHEQTGKNLPTLWTEFQAMTNFTPAAARMLEFQRELGFQDGKPPRDLKARLKHYVEQHADSMTRRMLNEAFIPGFKGKQVSSGRLALICYFTQPGGTAEAFLGALQENQALPGFAKGEHGSITVALKGSDLSLSFPVSRSITVLKKGEIGTYNYMVVRESEISDWKFQRAWKTNPDGRVVKEFALPSAQDEPAKGHPAQNPDCSL